MLGAFVVRRRSPETAHPRWEALRRLGPIHVVPQSVRARRSHAQILDHTLGLLVFAFAEVVLPNSSVVIDCSTEGNLHREVAEKAAYISTHDNHLGQIITALALYNTELCALWQRGMDA
jgi:hypothetical protein